MGPSPMTKPLDTPSSRLTLSALRDRARSLDARPQDIDALLMALDRPVWPGENVRPRADVLHTLIDDPVLGGLRGSDRRRVDETAVHALLALGEPYASELSADGQKVLQNAPPPPRRRPPIEAEDDDASAGAVESRFSPRRVVAVAFLIWGVVEVGFLLNSPMGSFGALLALLSVLTMTVPGLLLRRPLPRDRRTGPYDLYLVLNTCAIPFMLVVGVFSMFFGGSNEVNAQITAFLTAMVFGAGARLLLVIALAWARSTARARPG